MKGRYTMIKRSATKILLFLFIFVSIQIMLSQQTFATSLVPMPNVDISVGTTEDPQSVTSSLQVLFLLSIISLAPSLLITMTSFTRVIIVLHFTRSAIGTQQMPPNQILIGLALFITLFLMGPTFTKINENALQPYSAGQISQSEAIEAAMEPMREFMIHQVRDADLNLFASITGETYSSIDDMPNRVLIPAFIVGEVTKGFQAGFIIYIPFIVIDMVVASILMAMGMMMLPPAMISLPFKILLFVMIDGWNLIIEQTMRTFQ